VDAGNNGLVVGGRLHDVHRNPARSSSLLDGERDQVHGSRWRGGRAVLVVGCQQQQVVEEGFEPRFLGEQAVDSRRPAGGSWLGAGDLETGAEGGDGAAQLVGGVGHEPSLLGCGGL
jgi:hypothetical protein